MRKKWLPCETPNWSRNASILNTQPCCFTGVLAVRVSQSCISLFTVHATRWHWHREVLSKQRGCQQPGYVVEVTHRPLCPQSPSPWRQLRAAAPAQVAAGAAGAAGSAAAAWCARQQRRVERRPRLVWSNQHAPSHVGIGQHNHQINY